MAVVRAGIRSGRLASALQAVAATGHRLLAVQRAARYALWYPVFLAVLAYACVVVGLVFVTPRIIEVFDLRGPDESVWLFRLAWLGSNVPYWAPFPPLAILGFCVLAWRRWTRVPHPHGRITQRAFPLGRLAALGNMATFFQVLSLLVEHGVSVPEAVPLAASATGNRRLATEAALWAADVAAGGNAPRTRAYQAIPARIQWLREEARSQEELVAGLRRSADHFQQEAECVSEWLTIALPIFLTMVIGGGAVITYAVLVFVPWFLVLRHLAGLPLGSV